MRVELPPDHHGSFESVLIPKHERRLTGFDERTIAMDGSGVGAAQAL
ncbi:hypothetical protein CBM2609_A130016 [Cupriavidus taiwanensis]|nr:hypothetical protein CBM2604_A110016 [Cupriavidus taiwanensis]SOZ24606.1 hypothetical protein CBM2609_A130016 [Cupriavidus taiwanensis]SOZ44508.1 hypothetical protein CBM2610_A140016 [Cupriavidus taiwanensis]